MSSNSVGPFFLLLLAACYQMFILIFFSAYIHTHLHLCMVCYAVGIRFFILPSIHPCLLACLLTYLLAHLLACSHTHLLTYSLPHLLPPPLIYPFFIFCLLYASVFCISPSPTSTFNLICAINQQIYLILSK